MMTTTMRLNITTMKTIDDLGDDNNEDDDEDIDDVGQARSQ